MVATNALISNVAVCITITFSIAKCPSGSNIIYITPGWVVAALNAMYILSSLNNIASGIKNASLASEVTSMK